MTTQIHESPTPLMWVSSIAIVLFCGIGIAAFMGWFPTSFGVPSPESVVTVADAKPVHKTHMPVVNNSPSKVTCTECGVIESIRVINNYGNASGLGLISGAAVDNAMEHNAGAAKSYELTVRFDDGSRRVFNEANPPAWQSGDQVRVVDGTIRFNG